MYKPVRNLLCMLGALAMVACSSPSPEDALDDAAKQLQTNLENKQAGAAVRQLHEDFMARQSYNRQAAQQQMLGLFMRYKNVNIVVLNRQCQLDKGYHDLGHCTAQVTVTGAQGLIPERLNHYQVSSQWQLAGKEWQLLRLDWQ